VDLLTIGIADGQRMASYEARMGRLVRYGIRSENASFMAVAGQRTALITRSP